MTSFLSQNGESDEVWRQRIIDSLRFDTDWLARFKSATSPVLGLGALLLHGEAMHTLAERAQFEADFGTDFLDR